MHAHTKEYSNLSPEESEEKKYQCKNAFSFTFLFCFILAIVKICWFWYLRWLIMMMRIKMKGKLDGRARNSFSVVFQGLFSFVLLYPSSIKKICMRGHSWGLISGIQLQNDTRRISHLSALKHPFLCRNTY